MVGILTVAAIGGFIGGVISAMVPSLPTTYWMWKERPAYRWVLLAAWAIALTLIAVILIWMGSK